MLQNARCKSVHKFRNDSNERDISTVLIQKASLVVEIFPLTQTYLGVRNCMYSVQYNWV